jgi:hypothetical protein
MTCYKPIDGYLVTDAQGNKKFKADKDVSKASNKYMQVPCGRCYGCRLEKARQWAVRLVHESYQWSPDAQHFITLTYNDENLPLHGSLYPKHFTDFMKRLRRHFNPHNMTKRTKFFHCGEYGELCLNCGEPKYKHVGSEKCGHWSPTLGRPHYHAIIFGFPFKDLDYWKTAPSGEKMYRSKTLEKLWTKGYSTIGDVTFNSCSYTARYLMKKINGDQAEAHYAVPLETDPETGEIVRQFNRIPEYITMSRGRLQVGEILTGEDEHGLSIYKPIYSQNAIGAQHIHQHLDSIYNTDAVCHIDKQGMVRKSQPPRYYDKQLERRDENRYKTVKSKRERIGKNSIHTQERLDVMEQVKKAQTRNLERNYEAHHDY